MEIPVLPPLLNAIEALNPFEEAIRRVQARKAGAGDLFWSRDEARANFCVILEPDIGADQAIKMLPLAMAALGDCIGVLVPPQVAVQFRAPLKITVNGGIAGAMQAAVSRTDSGRDVPDWLIFGIEINLKRAPDDPEPGAQPELTTLDEEGCETPDTIRFIETFARHFLSWMATWEDEGFPPVARSWKFKAEDKSEPDLVLLRSAIVKYESKA